jgi:peroxiredoxin
MTNQNRLSIGAPAPDFTLLGVDGQPVALASLWANGPTVLTFLRHFG